MAFTTPKTWVNGQLVTDSDLNAHVRDNLRYLKGLDGAVSLDSGLTAPSLTATGAVSGASASFTGNATVGGTLGVTGVATFSALATFNSGATIAGASSPTLSLNTTAPGNRRTQIILNQSGNARWYIGNDTAQNNTQDFFIFDYPALAYRFVIDASGRIGIGGQITPSRTLDVTGTGRFTSWVSVGGNEFSTYNLTCNGSAIKTDGNSGWSITSDARAKDLWHRRPYTRGLAAIRALNPTYYRFNGRFGTDPTDEHVGLIAQEAEHAIPEMVAQIAVADGDLIVDDFRTLQTDALVYTLVNAVQEIAEYIGVPV